MDPFRDPLEAAHAKIAQLEKENAELRAVRELRPYPPRRRAGGGALIAFVTAGVILLLVVGALATFVLCRTPRVSVSPSEGIATAPLPTPVPSEAPRNRWANRPAAPVPTAAPQDPRVNPRAVCNCEVGDPLCSCL